MDDIRFDRLTRAWSRLLSRRTLTGAICLGALAIPSLVDAKKKRKRRKKKKKVTFNDFGCVNVGGFCKNSGQCCSGICKGKKGKKKCQAHDASTCQSGDVEAFCGGVSVPCTATDDSGGTCDTTTGNAPYCRTAGSCFACAKDADCVPFCGPQAACIVCEGLTCANFDLTTACAAAVGNCIFPP